MKPDWKQAEEVLNNIKVRGNEMNQPVSVTLLAEGLRCIGTGTDAAVFQYDKVPNYAFKVFSSEAASKKVIEESVYTRLLNSNYFASLFGTGENYLVLSFEQGVTLYDCLLRGIPIPEQVIFDVEEARIYVRKQGMNPRDIHLKNVLLQNGKGKVLDVSEYVLEGNDNRWEYLVWAYYRIYPLIKGKRIPSWILGTIKYGYYWFDKVFRRS